MGRRLRPFLPRIHGLLVAVDDIIADAILHIGGGIRRAVKPLHIRVILGEEQLGLTFTDQPPPAVILMIQLHHTHAVE